MVSFLHSLSRRRNNRDFELPNAKAKLSGAENDARLAFIFRWFGEAGAPCSRLLPSARRARR
jgi:hypothetical protein